MLVAPYHPSSNGLAERAVKTIKEGIWKMSEGSLLDKVSRFLFHYRLTPQSTTGKAPAELMMRGRIPRSRLDLVKPCLQERVHTKQQKQKQVHNKHSRERAFQEGERVYVKNYRGSGTQWLPGKIVSITGPVSAIVELADGTRVRKHFDQIRKREAEMVEHSGDEQSFELETESCTDVGDNLESSAEALESNDDPESGVREPEPSHQLPPPSTRKTYPRRSRKETPGLSRYDFIRGEEFSDCMCWTEQLYFVFIVCIMCYVVTFTSCVVVPLLCHFLVV